MKHIVVRQLCVLQPKGCHLLLHFSPQLFHWKAMEAQVFANQRPPQQLEIVFMRVFESLKLGVALLN